MDRSLEQHIAEAVAQFNKEDKPTQEHYIAMYELGFVFAQLAERVMKRLKDDKWTEKAIVCCFHNVKKFDGKSKAINFFTVCIIKEWHKSRRQNG
jgi:hypothetical protein